MNPSHLLQVDSRESSITRQKFQLLAEDHNDLEVEICTLSTGDYVNQYMVLESKSIDDFISSFTEKITRKDGTRYLRLDSQINRMLELDKPYKILLIHGDMSDRHSGIHENSIRGMMASIIAKGLTVICIPGDFNYPDMIYRLHRKTMKYGADVLLKKE